MRTQQIFPPDSLYGDLLHVLLALFRVWRLLLGLALTLGAVRERLGPALVGLARGLGAGVAPAGGVHLNS